MADLNSLLDAHSDVRLPVIHTPRTHADRPFGHAAPRCERAAGLGELLSLLAPKPAPGAPPPGHWTPLRAPERHP
ncbi:hypothetical protein GCM10023080_098890 [Streptomyces pseudoechinosporeus]